MTDPEARPAPTPRSMPVGAALALALVLAGPAAADPAAPPTVVVQTEGGAVAGMGGAVETFLGIPFAAPPVGAGRWRPPAPVVPWSGVREATQFGADCMQHRFPISRAPGVSEDCLTLNIWVPHHRTGPLPVMVWIYGGGFVGGSASTFDGAALAEKGVVVVAANYRAGIFGFLAHPGLSAESPHGASGNYGLMDQIAALRWVKANAAAFGGDPRRVTVFGESSGASSISHILASRQGRGLFQRAILQSPGAMRPLSTLAEAEHAGAALDPDLAALRAASAEDLLGRTDRMVAGVRGLTTPRVLGPIIDGWIVTGREDVAYARGTANRVPLIVGGNADEGRFFVGGWPIRTAAQYREMMAKTFGAAAPKALSLYPAATDADVHPALSAVFADTQFNYGVRGVARGMSGLGAPVYRYLFSYRQAGQSSPPTHGGELAFVFGAPQFAGAAAWSPQDHETSEAMMDAWIRFARTGDPNGGELPKWPRFRTATGGHLEFGDPIRAVAGDRSPQLDFLDHALGTTAPAT